MEQVFINLLNTSITAGWLVLAVLLLRPILKKAPKFIRCILWGLVGIRLVLPFSWESMFSLIPNSQTVPPEIVTTQTPVIQSGLPVINHIVNPILTEAMAPAPTATVTPMQTFMGIAWRVWLLGMAIMAAYSIVSFLLLKRKLREAVREEDNVWLCDRVSSPFLLGLFRPRIYLPSDLNSADRRYVLAHENAHIRRRDHWWKPLGFLLLTVYWFNPLLWVAYIFLCRDIEFSCDEKVIRELGETEKKPYSEALIHCSIPKKMISACPVAFGEEGVKGRIKSVLNYKKPAFWIILIAMISCIVVAVCFLSNPPEKNGDGQKTEDYQFTADVLEVRDASLLVKPLDGTAYFSGAREVVVQLKELDPGDYRVGSRVEIHFDGMIQELYPPIVPNAHSVINLDSHMGTIMPPESNDSIADCENILLHTAEAQRQATYFIMQATEYANATEYRICYREPDGCLTEVAFTGLQKQPLMICNERIYYQAGNTVYAIDFSGKTVASIALPQNYYIGWLLHCDGKNIYGAAGDKGIYCYRVDLDLTAYTELSAMPAHYRKLDTQKLTEHIAATMQCNSQAIRVHKGNIIYDANGMVTSMLLTVSAEHNGTYQAGTVVFSWYNNQKSYDEALGNPFFNRSDTVYENTPNDMALADFLNYVINLEKSDMIKGETPEEFAYRFYFNGGISSSEELGNPQPVCTSPGFDVLKTYPVVVYAYQLGENSWRFCFYENTSISGSMASSAMYGFDGMDAESAKKELAQYNLPPEEIPVVVINSYISSYLYDIDENTILQARDALGLIGNVSSQLLMEQVYLEESAKETDYAYYISKFPSKKNVGTVSSAETVIQKAMSVWQEVLYEYGASHNPYNEKLATYAYYDEQNGYWCVHASTYSHRENVIIAGGGYNAVIKPTGEVLAVWFYD